MEANTRAADGLRYGCPGCGSGLRYDIAEAKMRCDSCGQTYAVDQIPDLSKSGENGMMETTEYRCPQCGAAVHASQTAATSFCSFCGADVILSQRLARVMRPDGIVPFRVTREACERIFRRRVEQARFTPPDFAREETISHFRPIYIPFWRYAGQTQGENLSGTAVHRHADAHYDYVDKYAYDVSGSVETSGVIYDASVSFEDETAQHLQFSTGDVKPFHPGYLCGFSAETPDTQPSLYNQGLSDVMREAWEAEFARRADSGYRDHRVEFPAGSLQTHTDLVLLPVWLLAHRSGGRVVYTAINGDSGEIVCDTPISNRRFALLAAALTLALIVALTLAQTVLLLRPKLLAALCALTAATAQWVVAGVSRDLEARRTRKNDPTWTEAHAQAAPDAKQKSKKKRKPYVARTLWYVPPLAAALITGAAVIVLAGMGGGKNKLIAGMVGDRGWMAPTIAACSLALFVFSGYKRVQRADTGLYFARMAAVAVTLACLLLTDADLVFYLCCIAMLALSALSLLRLNREHNEYVSRPVPFFGEEGAQT